MSLELGSVVLIAITLFAAFVNGALGYGFSSLTVPVGLLFYTNRVLNPALVLIEVFVNIYVLFINRASIPAVWRRVYPILLGLLPGVAVGSYFLASIHPGWLKFATYALLMPLILLQASGLRRPLAAERLVGVPFGAGLGFLYSVSTISGPPLALFFNNQGLVKQDFRAGLGLIRVVESSLTALAYFHLGLFAGQALEITALIVPGVLIGIPLGALAIQRLNPETFRRICMTFDLWVVGFGLSRVLIELHIAEAPVAYGPMAIAILLDIYLLSVFFRPKSATGVEESVRGPVTKPLALASVHRQRGAVSLGSVPAPAGTAAEREGPVQQQGLRHFAFNGDADGLCAVQQLRLARPGPANLVTGVKREITLLRHIAPRAGDDVVALDISLHENRDDLVRLLDAGARVTYFDHHRAGQIPVHPGLDAHIDESADVCTSILVDRHLKGEHRPWAIVAAFGDNLNGVARAMASRAGISTERAAALEHLGVCLNYNAYGESVDDLHFHPAELSARLLPYADPFAFMNETPIYAKLRAGYEDDMAKARSAARRVYGSSGIVVLPNAPWARRAIGVLINELAQERPNVALAILSPKSAGGYTVSVRVPPTSAVSAADFCKDFATGGGRKSAGGINHLPEGDVERFAARFEARFRGR